MPSREFNQTCVFSLGIVFLFLQINFTQKCSYFQNTHSISCPPHSSRSKNPTFQRCDVTMWNILSANQRTQWAPPAKVRAIQGRRPIYINLIWDEWNGTTLKRLEKRNEREDEKETRKAWKLQQCVQLQRNWWKKERKGGGKACGREISVIRKGGRKWDGWQDQEWNERQNLLCLMPLSWNLEASY